MEPGEVMATSTILLFFCEVILFGGGPQFSGRPEGTQPSVTKTVDDNSELARLYQEDQADRAPVDAGSIDWGSVTKRDRARLLRVKELYKQNLLRTGVDYYNAAMILQHGDTAEDYLLAHELCVVAISKGETRGKWLAAASEDRFLTKIGRSQRFGTQYEAQAGGPYRLLTVEAGVSDDLRRALDVPSLAEARSREVELNKK